jgi:hypothetical protein
MPTSSLTDSVGLLSDSAFDGLRVDLWWLNLPGHVSPIARAADLASDFCLISHGQRLI